MTGAPQYLIVLDAAQRAGSKKAPRTNRALSILGLPKY
jgi:hypothetical protein